MLTGLPPVWNEKLTRLCGENFYQSLVRFLDAEYSAGKSIYPERGNILRALQSIDLPEVKVVILGQDPYHQPGQALGLSFGNLTNVPF